MTPLQTSSTLGIAVVPTPYGKGVYGVAATLYEDVVFNVAIVAAKLAQLPLHIVVLDPALMLDVGQVWENDTCWVNKTSKNTWRDLIKKFIYNNLLFLVVITRILLGTDIL